MCIFCDDIKQEQIIYETDDFKVVFDIDPEQEGHMLLISKHHYMNYQDLPDEVVFDLIHLERKMIRILEDEMNIYGVSIIRNNGRIMDDGTHFHVHIIPRYKGDKFWSKEDTKQVFFDFNLFLSLLS
ncbi:HIT family protein [Macrococcoides caseolyticum]|uniref:HIT family protein n=1 Tax=Macrococcoides caseolyticum TaxID=69966 RepID=UPI001F4120D8|nr:HIT family protein [Macrococcus caseolyticus]MCE4956816.1 HIT family protein [Macrococcus caseolyticus]